MVWPCLISIVMMTLTFILFFSTIPLLGYLPQEMVGVSIFDFYHNDDIGVLYNIYKQGNIIYTSTLLHSERPKLHRVLPF